ncbi:UNVERIFIED_CONTAM: putative protein phosphatase 2C 55 [Sesamum calycinum]|uniref:Protein phosphatase n=1 Tax=Sesamum calycinum TaxID=2727403 RepID=A0AAW2QMB1_9LAMI
MPSNCFRRLRGGAWEGVWRLISGKETGIQDQFYGLIGQGKLLLGHSRLLHSLPSGAFTDLHVFVRPGTVAAAQANLYLANRRKNISVVGAFSRQSPFHLFPGLHFKCVVIILIVCYQSLVRPAQPGVAAYHSFSSYSRSSFENCRKATMSLQNKEQPNNFLLYGYFIYNVAKRKGNSNPFLGFGFEGFHISSPAYSSTGTAPDVSFDNSMKEEQHSSPADSSELNVPIDRTLKLNSGSCYLPHPDKEETGGEDAHFICTDEQAIGVADGVGGWADLGVDAGQYARELMSNSVNAIQEEPRGSVDPARVLEKAYTSTKAKGSSTACIIALTDQGLHAINLGDSGFMVVRDGCTVFRSPVQQHDFNFTYQLESGNAGDLPSSGQVFTVPVAPGDVVIAGTDGLFDNCITMTLLLLWFMLKPFHPKALTREMVCYLSSVQSDRSKSCRTNAVRSATSICCFYGECQS